MLHVHNDSIISSYLKTVFRYKVKREFAFFPKPMDRQTFNTTTVQPLWG